MFVPPRRQALVYPTTSHVRPNIAGTQFKIAVPDANWYKTWPKSSSSLLGSLLLITSAAIIGLDIANLAIEGKKDDSYLLKGLGLGVAKVGAGLWAGCSTFLAGILVLVIACVNNKRVAATFALIATIIGFILSIVLLAFTANTIQLYPAVSDETPEALLTPINTKQRKLIIAMLALSIFNLVLCFSFFIIYNIVYFSPFTRRPTKY